jgi:carbamoyltransferase
LKILGISEGYHDAAVCIIEDCNIIYASHAERYSKKKNDSKLSSDQIPADYDKVVFYEKGLLKNTRRIYSGQGWKSAKLTLKHNISFNHHWSHAAAAYYTRPFLEEPVCVVIDAIGEWDTATIWYNKKKVWSMKYPESLGLFYSAATQSIGLKPNEDEYITMGMSAFGSPIHKYDPLINYHKGGKFVGEEPDVAASVQSILEIEILKIMKKARKYSAHLCYGGGVALNCLANSKIRPMFNNMWIMPNPGDAGSSLGAAAAYLDKPLNWIDPYLGYNIERPINVKEVVKYLIDNSYCGIANGRAEFGPRALGNRSLIADPRVDIKNTINKIKKRQTFRPFAPAILSEFANEYFDGPMNEYMQFVAKAKHDYYSVSHVDGTARVQVVKPDCKSILRLILEEWYEETGCPMLLNTSLNIKGMPMVNDESDAYKFQSIYNVRVF